MSQRQKIQVFERVLADYGGFLESTIWKLTGNHQLFAEAHQNALLAIWRHIEKFNNQHAGGYIYKIALSSVSRAWRDAVGMKAGKSTESPEALTSPEEGPQEQIIRQEVLGMVRRMVGELPKQQGKAVIMRYFEGKSYSEVGEGLQCSESGARAHVSKAIARLRKDLSQLFEKQRS